MDAAVMEHRMGNISEAQLSKVFAQIRRQFPGTVTICFMPMEHLKGDVCTTCHGLGITGWGKKKRRRRA